MTKERLEAFAGRLNDINAEFAADVPQADSAVETILYGLAEVIDEDAKANENDKTINAMLKGISDMLRHAAFDYYASWK